jgi:hypothetical protein
MVSIPLVFRLLASLVHDTHRSKGSLALAAVDSNDDELSPGDLNERTATTIGVPDELRRKGRRAQPR